MKLDSKQSYHTKIMYIYTRRALIDQPQTKIIRFLRIPRRPFVVSDAVFTALYTRAWVLCTASLH